MAKGFNMGAVLLLDYVESLATLLTHPIHEEWVYLFLDRTCHGVLFTGAFGIVETETDLAPGFTSYTKRSAIQIVPWRMIWRCEKVFGWMLQTTGGVRFLENDGIMSWSCKRLDRDHGLRASLDHRRQHK